MDNNSPEKKITLSEVNDKLLARLYDVIEGANSEELLNITESIAKLNASYKGNSQFSDPMSEEEKNEAMAKEALEDIIG